MSRADTPRTHRHGSLRQEVYQQVRDRILQGYYPDGGALTEARVSADLGVSRTPVREAFSRLEIDGLVESTPNKSIVVRRLSEQDILDLYVMRGHLESLAAERAAVHLTSDGRSALSAAFQTCREVLLDPQADVFRMQAEDARFHEQIFAASGSKILLHFIHSIRLYTQQSRLVSLATPGRSRQVADEHEAVLQAILAGDGPEAAERMRRHITCAGAAFARAAEMPPLEETALPREQTAQPMGMVSPPREQVSPPREQSAPPLEPVAPPREQAAPPREQAAPPREQVTPPRRRSASSAKKRKDRTVPGRQPDRKKRSES